LSSILATIRNDILRNPITVGQVALSFLLAGFNWAAITTWTTYNLSKLFAGTWLFDWQFWGGLGLIIVWPIVLSAIGSMFSPERVTIAPLDINGLTVGIYVVTLWTAINPLHYADGVTLGLTIYGFSLYITVFSLLTFSLVQLPISKRLIGIAGTENQLRYSIFRTRHSKQYVEDFIGSPLRRNALGLKWSDNLDDKTLCFYGRPDGAELHVALSEQPSGTTLTIVTFEIASLGLKQVNELWFEARIAAILTVLKKLKLKQEENAVLPRVVSDHVLAPTRGLMSRFQDIWSGLARHLVAAVVLGIADYFFWFNKIIAQDSAIQLGFFIALYVVGVSVISRRKR